MFFLYDFLISTSLGERFVGSGLRQISSFNLADAQSFEGDSSTKWRLIFFATAFQLFLENPVFGIGLDGFKTIFAADLYSHSNILEVASTLGMFGVFFYYYFVGRLWLCLVSIPTFGRVAALLILIFLEFTMVSYFERFYLIVIVLLMKFANQQKPGLCDAHKVITLKRVSDR